MNYSDEVAGLIEHLEEMSNLYEIARGFLGARSREQVASLAVWSGMGTLGLRSGSALVPDDRDRLRVLYSSLDEAKAAEPLTVSAAAREWMLREGVFTLGPAAARALGPLRDRLVERFDATLGITVADPSGMLGLLLFGPPLFESEDRSEAPGMLESIGSLTAMALAGRSDRAAATRRRPAGPTREARTMEALHAAYPPLRTLVGSSREMIEACQDLVAIAGTHFPALVTGESGTGKELAAHAIHELSDRARGPFEVVDCGSIPRELIESELFGHVRGAFTGAHRDRRGAFDLAQRGTLFLDEIGEMPLQLQTRLLRVLQEGRFRRVGDERTIETDARMVAATHRDLRAEVTDGRFREDLFYRLNVFTVRLPPLRERASDIGPLVQHFLRSHGQRLGVRPFEVAPEVIEALEACPWPGNVRQLGNLCAALAVRGRERREITLEDLERLWVKQNDGEEPPWQAGTTAPRGDVGGWVLEQARATGFNLVHTAQLLQRKARGGTRVPLAERSALSYYLMGEILRALARAEGDAGEAARSLAGGDIDLARRISARVGKVREALRTAADEKALRRRFSKLPSGYEEALLAARRVVVER